MPSKRKAGSISGTPAKSTSGTKSNATTSTTKKSVAAKTKGSKKETTQSHTLFDFYPNLSKNAPLFRPSLTADEPFEAGMSRKSSVATDDYDAAMAALDQSIDDAPATKDNLGYDHEKKNDVEGQERTKAAFGPFSLDDDEEDLLDDRTATIDSPDLDRFTVGSSKDTDRTSESSVVAETDDEKYAKSLSMQIDEYRDDQGEEIEMQEERDRFENGDDEMNEDEQWTWQEYNAENFGQHDSRDESVLCPMCGLSIISFSEHDRSAHVNRCLDLPPPLEEENQVNGKALVDATVVREMNNNNTPPPLVKAESCAADVKLEHGSSIPESPRVKPEPVDDEIEDVPDIDVVMEEVKDEPVDDIGSIKHEPIDSKLGIKSEFGDVKSESKDVKPSLGRGASNAFEKIMVGHSEEKQWADAARTENLQRGTKYKTRICPFYKILSPFPIAVDAFKYGTVPGVQGYYLTHFHSDHYGGLSSTWDAGPIYCSSITGNLVIQQLRVRPEYVVKLPMDVPTDINGVTVTLIDANHCPGSTLFLFEGEARGRILRYLHCGDYRATPVQLLHPAVRGKHIDSLYLDTTYLSPKYAFPSQEDVIEACSHVCRDLAGLLPDDANPVADARKASGMTKFLNSASAQPTTTTSAQTPAAVKDRGRLLVVVGTYSIGKERIVLGIAKALGSKIYAAQRKRDILSCLEDDELSSRITDDPLAAQVHMTYLQEIRAETLLEYMHTFRGEFKRVVGFRGTGWTYSPPKTRFLDNPTVEQIMAWNPRYSFRMMSPGRGSTSVTACYGVPYSEHSSFRELMCFCLSMRVGRVIPTVNVGSEKSRKNMKGWIDKWAIEVRKNGVRPIKDGSTEWM